MNKSQKIMERIISDQNKKQWGMAVHLAAFAALIGIPLGNVIGPLIIYLIKRDEYEFVAQQGKEVINFQITWTLILILSAILIFVGIGVLMLIGFGIAWFILVIVGAVAASNGQYYKYPLSFRFLN